MFCFLLATLLGSCDAFAKSILQVQREKHFMGLGFRVEGTVIECLQGQQLEKLVVTFAAVWYQGPREP